MKSSVDRALNPVPGKLFQAMCRFVEGVCAMLAGVDRRAAAGALVPCFAIGSSGLAHHSYIRIDRNVIVAFEATVVDFDWRNPHVAERYTLNWDYTPDFEFYRYDRDPEVAARLSLP